MQFNFIISYFQKYFIPSNIFYLKLSFQKILLLEFCSNIFYDAIWLSDVDYVTFTLLICYHEICVLTIFYSNTKSKYTTYRIWWLRCLGWLNYFEENMPNPKRIDLNETLLQRQTKIYNISNRIVALYFRFFNIGRYLIYYIYQSS